MALLVTRRVEVSAYGPDLALTGVVVGRNSDASSASFTVAHNGVGTGTVTLPVDHTMVPALLTPGARLQYRYLYDAPILEMSGPVVASQAGLTPRGAVITFTSVSDDVLLRSLAWPKPTAALSAQTDEYDTNTGAIDGAVRDLVTDNLVTRLGLNIRMVPIFPDGPTGTIKARFHTLAEVIYPALESANKGIRIYQWNPGDAVPFYLTGLLTTPCLLVDIYTPTDRPYVLFTPVLGINTGTASTTAPTTTRVIVGGQGDGTARTFTQFTSAPLEAEWGALFTREVFVDARDTADAVTTAQRGNDALTAGAPNGALAVTTVDGEPWTVGTHYTVGDRVQIAAITGQVVATEVVRSITCTVTAAGGTTITPQIGDPSTTADPDQALARALAELAGRMSNLESRK